MVEGRLYRQELFSGKVLLKTTYNKIIRNFFAEFFFKKLKQVVSEIINTYSYNYKINMVWKHH